MNPKHFIPTWRTRYRLVERVLRERGPFGAVLNLGCGEGDMDAMLRVHCRELHACDIHEGDVAFARAFNAELHGVTYSVQDAMALEFPDDHFDVLVSVDVIEHAAEPATLVGEAARVLRPGGLLVLTGPSHRFPVSYDPLNLVLRRAGLKVPFGAYGYGHEELLHDEEMVAILDAHGFELRERMRLSHFLVGASECYWPSAVQRLVKQNVGNRAGAGKGRAVRPWRNEVPRAAGVVDALIDVDARLFGRSSRSVGLAYVAVLAG